MILDLSPGRSRGFTLIEVLIAVAIGATTLVVISTVTFSTLESRRALERDRGVQEPTADEPGTERAMHPIEYLRNLDHALSGAAYRRFQENGFYTSAHPILVEHTDTHIVISWTALTATPHDSKALFFQDGNDSNSSDQAPVAPSALEGWRARLPLDGQKGEARLESRPLTEARKANWVKRGLIENARASLQLHASAQSRVKDNGKTPSQRDHLSYQWIDSTAFRENIHIKATMISLETEMEGRYKMVSVLPLPKPINMHGVSEYLDGERKGAAGSRQLNTPSKAIRGQGND